MSLRHLFGHVAGETFRNDDGSDRQRIIARCRVGERLVLEHEPDNPHDINAIRVLRQSGEQIGYLEREFAGEVVSRAAKGWRYHAAIAGIGRAKGRGPYGVSLLIIVENDATEADVAVYAANTLAAEDRADDAPSVRIQHGPRGAGAARPSEASRWGG